MFKEKEIITAIELNDNWLKIAQAVYLPENKKGKLVKIVVRKISATDDVSRLLRNVIKEEKIKITRLVTVIPRTKLKVNFLKLPSVDDKEIKDIVNFQATRQIPYSKNEIIFDYQIIGYDDDGYSHVLLAICHKDTVSEYTTVFEKAGFYVDKIMLSSEAVLNLYSINKVYEEIGVKTILLVYISDFFTDMQVIIGDRLFFTRAVNIGYVQIENGRNKKKITALIHEIKQTLNAYRKEEKTKKIEKLVLVCPDNRENNDILKMVNMMIDEFSVEVDVINMLEKVDIKSFALYKCDLCIISGMVLTGAKKALNLLPENIRDNYYRTMLRNQKMIMLVLTFLIVFAVIIGISAQLYIKQQYLNLLKHKMAQIYPHVKQIEKKAGKVKVIKQQLNSEFSSIDILAELFKIITGNISVSNYTYDDSGKIIIQGNALTMNDIFNLVNALEKSPYFKNVETKYATKRRKKDAEIIDFQIKCQLKDTD